MVTNSTSPPKYYEYHCFISYTTREEEIRILKPFLDDSMGFCNPMESPFAQCFTTAGIFDDPTTTRRS